MEKRTLTEKGVDNMWIDTRDCVPLADGEYIVQTVCGRISYMHYTSAGGWNTHTDTDGNLHTEDVITDLYVARWFEIPQPEKVPEAWFDEYWAHEKGGE